MESTNTENLIKDKLIRMELTNIRKSKHLTQDQISEISGLSKSCISNIESGESSSPTLRSLIRYVNALGVNIFVGDNNL